MNTKETRLYWLLIKSDTLFNILGPVKEDQGITNVIAELQRTGENIRCEAIDYYTQPSLNSLKTQVERELHLIFDQTYHTELSNMC